MDSTKKRERVKATPDAKLLNMLLSGNQNALQMALSHPTMEALAAVEETITKYSGKPDVTFYRLGGERIYDNDSGSAAKEEIIKLASSNSLLEDPAYTQSLIASLGNSSGINNIIMAQLAAAPQKLYDYQLLGVQMQLAYMLPKSGSEAVIKDVERTDDSKDFMFSGGEITSYAGSDTKITVPGKINGQNVTQIGIRSFSNKNIESVTLPSSVTEIKARAFENNNLKQIDLPDDLESIETAAFAGNQLTEITFPQTLKKINHGAFKNNMLRKVYIPDGVTYIGEYAFNANKMENASISSRRILDTGSFDEGVTIIERNSENGKDAINNEICDFEFRDSGEGSVSVKKYIGASKHVAIPGKCGDKIVDSIGDEAFLGNGIESVIIPNTIKVIGEDAFYDNQLTEAVIPDSVEVIYSRAFKKNRLSRLTVSKNLTQLGAGAFFDNNFTRVRVPYLLIQRNEFMKYMLMQGFDAGVKIDLMPEMPEERCKDAGKKDMPAKQADNYEADKEPEPDITKKAEQSANKDTARDISSTSSSKAGEEDRKTTGRKISMKTAVIIIAVLAVAVISLAVVLIMGGRKPDLSDTDNNLQVTKTAEAEEIKEPEETQTAAPKMQVGDIVGIWRVGDFVGEEFVLLDEFIEFTETELIKINTGEKQPYTLKDGQMVLFSKEYIAAYAEDENLLFIVPKDYNDEPILAQGSSEEEMAEFLEAGND